MKISRAEQNKQRKEHAEQQRGGGKRGRALCDAALLAAERLPVARRFGRGSLQRSTHARKLRAAGGALLHMRLNERRAFFACKPIRVQRKQIPDNVAVHHGASSNSLKIIAFARKKVTRAQDSVFPAASPISRKGSPESRRKNTCR